MEKLTNFREGRAMKAKFLVIIPVILLAACHQAEQEDPTTVQKPEETVQNADGVWTLTIQASKGDADTKALDLSSDGSTLSAYWLDTEKVKVYKDGTYLGRLDVTPSAGERPTTATLSGEITVTGLSQGTNLTLMIPNGDTWSYTDQTGTLSSIQANYDYAMATVSVESISGSAVTTTSATFDNMQSIYRFGFKLNSNYFDPADFTVSSAGGHIVTGRALSGSEWTSSFGSLLVSPSAASDHFYYVSIRNESTAADTYNFNLHDNVGTLYMGAQAIPATSLATSGRFISAKNIVVTQPSFAPASGEVSSSSAVL